MKSFTSAVAFVVVAAFPIFNQVTDCFRHDLPSRRKGLFGKESKNIYFGIPLLYQQKIESAYEFANSPLTIMDNWNDYKYRNNNNHPLEERSISDTLTASNLLHHRSHRAKRGIILNKLKKIKKGIQKAKKKIWKLKEKAIRVIKGPKSTVRPSYESTGGSWGNVGWGAVRTSTKSSGYMSHGSQGSYGLNDQSSEYGVSRPVGKASASYGWSSGPKSRSSERSYRPPRSSYNYPYSGYQSYGPVEDNDNRSFGPPSEKDSYQKYGPPINKEPSYKGLAVRSRIK